MLTVTDKAKDALTDAIDQIEEPTPENACFRIIRGQDNQLTLSLGVPDDQDVTVETSDRTILAISPDIAEACEDRTLDVSEETEDGRCVLTLT